MNTSLSSRPVRIAALATSIAIIGTLLVSMPQVAVAGPSTVTTTFSYTGSAGSFTVPAGITALTITATGAEGGNGGRDATPAPDSGGYRGVVSGTIAVTPGQVLTVGVGSGGATGAGSVSASTPPAIGGSNPLSGYSGGKGGQAGTNGSSGAGGAGGAATVVQIEGVDVVAGGGGGNGGSGQFASTRGRTATATYLGRSDTITTLGQAGINANDACVATSCSNNDGGGSGGGGGGALGGAQGQIEFGAGSSNEWYGFAGSVGQNSTASFSGLTSTYQYHSDNSAAGSVVISYTTGPPSSPTAVSGTAADGSVDLIWTTPIDSGQTVISDYLVQYSSNGGATWSSPSSMGSTDTATTITGLTNGTSYLFQVAAVNSIGTSAYSASSAAVTPLGPPTAPTISLVTAQDGALSLTLTAPSSGAPATGYDYRVDGGSWVAVASSSTTLVIPGLINGTSYSVEVRAASSAGPGAVSAPASGTPLAVPGAPTISSLAIEDGTLSVSFTPGFSGGGAITSYQYQLNGGSWTTASGTSSPLAITGLSAGTDYSVALRAVNSVGAGAASAPASVTTPAVPGAPTITTVVAGDGTARIGFTPGTTGGSPIQRFEYQTTAGGSWVTVPGAASPVLISGLTNGTEYFVSVRAINSVGTGAASAATAVTPATVPSAPSIIGDTVAGSDATLSAAFTAPTSTGGAAITNYEYSTDAGATWRTRTDGDGTSSPVVITTKSSDGTTPLTNGVTYYVELRAVNAVGAGTASAVASGIATTSPSKPTITAVTPSNGSLGVRFTAGSNGGSAITSYQYSIDAGAHWVATGTLGTSFVIGDLINGTAYSVRVRATNSVGAGVASTAVAATPVGLPGKASINGVVRSNQTLTTSVSLTNNGGSPITAWEYSTDNGASWATATGTTSPLALTTLSTDGTTRLANGTGYALQVRAVTAVGTGPASATTIVAPASAPAAPSIAVTAGNANVSVVFSLGTDGGSPVTQLDYSLDSGAHWIAAGTLSSPFAIGGLTNGTAYTVQLRADNAIGAGASSVPASATPRTVPGAPGSVTAVSNTASADVSWSAPASTGGAAVSGYIASAYLSSTGTTVAATCSTGGATTCSITGLTNGTAYYVEVAATNAAGTGVASTPRVLVTPLARPSAPTLNSLTVGDASMNAAFSAGSAGDRPITHYEYSLDGGTTWATASGTTSPIQITGLTNGTTYTVALRAVSTAGNGATSNTKQATPFTYPSTPDTTTIVANGGNGRITVSWDAANLNGGTLLNYTATAFTGLSSGSTAATCTTTGLSCAITGLSNGTTYYISLQTQNTSNMYSVRSVPRVPATPSLQPGAATGVTAVAGDASATVSWAAPTSTGASAITGYTVWCSVDGGAYTQCATPSTTSASVTGLTNGSSYTFKVFAVNANGTGPASAPSDAVTPLNAGSVPTFDVVTQTTTGFTSAISNYDAGTTYTATATNGADVVVSGSTITVTGLSNGAGSRVTVTATKATTTTTSATLDGAALLTGVVPTFSSNVATTDGFTFTITNYSASVSYALTTSSGTITRSGNRVTVSGLGAGASAVAKVVATRDGYTSASKSITGRANAAVVVPDPVTTDPTRTDPSSTDPTTTDGSPLDATSGRGGGGSSSSGSGSSAVLTPLRSSEAGAATVTTDGGTVASTVKKSKTTVTVSAPNGLTLSVAATKDGALLSLAADGVVEVDRSGQLVVTMTGLAPASGLTIWSMANSRELAVANADASGESVSSVLLPRSLAPGVHTLVVTGVDADGNPVTMQVGIRVLDAEATSSTSPIVGSAQVVLPWWPWLFTGIVLLLIFAWWFVIARRRRIGGRRTA